MWLIQSILCPRSYNISPLRFSLIFALDLLPTPNHISHFLCHLIIKCKVFKDSLLVTMSFVYSPSNVSSSFSSRNFILAVFFAWRTLFPNNYIGNFYLKCMLQLTYYLLWNIITDYSIKAHFYLKVFIT